jgi:hypothetical protein
MVSSLRLTLSKLAPCRNRSTPAVSGVVRFPTGPSYDRHLAKALPGLKTEDLDYPGNSRPTDWKNFWLQEMLPSGSIIRSGQRIQDQGRRQLP